MADNIADQSDSNTVLRRIQFWVQSLALNGVTISPGDIEIGAVEIKDSASDQRTTVSSRGALLVEGAQADDTAAAQNPNLVAGVTVDPTSLPADTVAGRAKRFLTNLKGILLSIIPNLDADYDTVRQFALPGNTWAYAAAASGISNTTTAVTIKTAAGVGIRNYITSLQIISSALGVATEIAIRDGAAGTVLWRGFITTAGMLGGQPFVFPVPLRGSANTLLEIVTLTASVTGTVYVNAQGFVSAI